MDRAQERSPRKGAFSFRRHIAQPAAGDYRLALLREATESGQIAVYGSEAPPAQKAAAYAPGNPYSATKAAADHLVSVWHHTYGLPVLVTHCSNN